MDRALLMGELERIVCAALEIPSVSPTLSMDTTPEWDSLRHVQLLYAIEEAFSVRIEPEDALRLTSLAAIAAFLAARRE